MLARFILASFALTFAGAQRPTTHQIGQKDKRFSQAEVTIAAGDSILFANNDGVIHNIYSNSAGFEFNLRRQAPGSSTAIGFSGRGTALVRCAFHPTMKLAVAVR